MSGPGSFGKKCLFITRGQGEEREQTKTNNRMMCMINSLTHPLFRPSLVYCQGRIERTTTAGVLLDSHSISQQGGNCKRVKGEKKSHQCMVDDDFGCYGHVRVPTATLSFDGLLQIF